MLPFASTVATEGTSEVYVMLRLLSDTGLPLSSVAVSVSAGSAGVFSSALHTYSVASSPVSPSVYVSVSPAFRTSTFIVAVPL